MVVAQLIAMEKASDKSDNYKPASDIVAQLIAMEKASDKSDYKSTSDVVAKLLRESEALRRFIQRRF